MAISLNMVKTFMMLVWAQLALLLRHLVMPVAAIPAAPLFHQRRELTTEEMAAMVRHCAPVCVHVCVLMHVSVCSLLVARWSQRLLLPARLSILPRPLITGGASGGPGEPAVRRAVYIYIYMCVCVCVKLLFCVHSVLPASPPPAPVAAAASRDVMRDCLCV